jgi:hypothetical protein
VADGPELRSGRVVPGPVAACRPVPGPAGVPARVAPVAPSGPVGVRPAAAFRVGGVVVLVVVGAGPGTVVTGPGRTTTGPGFGGMVNSTARARAAASAAPAAVAARCIR